MQGFHLRLIDVRGLPATALKYARRTFQQGPLPLMDHCGMHTETAGQFADRLLALQRFQCDLGLKLGVRLLPFRQS